MSPEVMVKVGEDWLPLEKCEWVWFSACGCPLACSHADTAEEEAAWRDMFHYAKERAAARKKGVTAELMSRERYRTEVAPKMSLSYTCPHNKEKSD